MNDLWEEISKGTFVIAEIGKNIIQTKEDEGIETVLKNAKALAKAAKDAGADGAKFQVHTICDEQLAIDVKSPHFSGSDRYSWVDRNEQTTPINNFWRPLKAYCNKIGIIFFASPMSRGAAQKLDQVGVPLWKVGSGDLLDFAMLDYIASRGQPIIISTGMSKLEEVDLAVNFLKRRDAQFAMLHCVSKYPCPPEDLNLASIKFLKERYRIPVGFSDHSVGEGGAKISLMAAKLGATVIEKHFTFDRDFWGPDHKSSILPSEMKQLTDAVKSGKYKDISDEEVRLYLGREDKILEEGEAVFRSYFRKSLMAARDIKKGETITKEMVFAMRPQKYAKGLPSENFESVLGKKSRKKIGKYDPINRETIQV